MKKFALLILSLCFLGTSTQVAEAAETAIVNARIYTITSDQPIENGTILIDDGKIAAVGRDVVVPDGAAVIDARGQIVTPGLISPATQLGLTEVMSNADTNDQKTTVKGLGAGFDIQYAVNPNSVLVQQARADGVTRAVTMPGAAPDTPFNGLGALLHLKEGTDIVEMGRFGEFAAIGAATDAGDGGSRAGQWVLLRRALDAAKAYRSRHRNVPEDFTVEMLNIEALKPVIDGKIPLVIDARRESDIRQAIRLKDDYDIQVIILGGTEAWRAASALASAKIPVMLDASENMPATFDELGASYRNAAILQRAGVVIAIYPDGVLHFSLNTGLGAREAAGLAAANGLPYIEALKALTYNVARIWGIDERAGSIAKGLDADLVIWDGDPLEPANAPVMVMVDGKSVSLQTRQTELRDRYLSKQRGTSWPAGYR